MERDPPFADSLLWSWVKQQRLPSLSWPISGQSLQSYGRLSKNGHNISHISTLFTHSLCNMIFWLFSSKGEVCSHPSTPWIWPYGFLWYLVCDWIWQKWQCVSSEVRAQEVWLPLLSLVPYSHQAGLAYWRMREHKEQRWVNLNIPTGVPDMLEVLAEISKVAYMT